MNHLPCPQPWAPPILPHFTQGWDAVQPVGISIFQCGFYVAGGSCLVYLYVYSLRLVYSVRKMVLSGVTALQVTRKQPGNTYRHPGLTWLPATLTWEVSRAPSDASCCFQVGN